MRPSDAIPVLYLAPWVDYGGSDKGTIDWFRRLDRTRFEPILVTTQPSDNRRLGEILPYAAEVWPLSELMAGRDMPRAIFDLIEARGIRLLHVMNSRLGFELLPDLTAFPSPPAAVVQLHVEEADRSGYVRYVTTRFGNLVDAFSVSSEHLAEAVAGYDVPRSRIHVIRTGVDAEEEFSPERVAPVPLDGDGFRVLYPGRLAEQKDPLLMVEAAARLTALRPDASVHVVGDGPLEPQVRERVDRLGLQDRIHFHPPTRELAGWYAACDALLMTSTFEGVPYVLYEAMAMGLPAVVPALPGNVELLGEGDPGLISPRDDAGAYAAALAALAGDPARREAIGGAHRERARRELSVQTMADAHAELYDRVLEDRPPPAPRPRAPRTEPVRLPPRPADGTPLVSIVVPCFNHGRYLTECLERIRAQTYPELEVIVVDDASTEPETRALLDRLEAADDVRLLRRDVNGGPSRARNAGIAEARGRYVLPVDADNLLYEHAVERLVAQLAEAPPDVGFVYPSMQFFGTRRDYFEAPPFNLYWLMFGNFADTCSLVDRSVYDAGLRYAEDIVMGHEDWDFALQLAERGILGEPSRDPVLRFRKHGFSRSARVDHAAAVFHEELHARHAALFDDAAAIKARWAPGLSIVALTPTEPGSDEDLRLQELLRGQTTGDVELLTPPDAFAPGDTPAATLEHGVAVARGRLTLVTAGTGHAQLERREWLEQILRVFATFDELDAIVLADAGAAGLYPLQLLEGVGTLAAAPHAIAFRSGDESPPLPGELNLDAGDPIASIVRELSRRRLVGTQWRHLPETARLHGAGELRRTRVRRPEPRDSGERLERVFLDERAPLVPAMAEGRVSRWVDALSWMPAESYLLCRHKRIAGEERRVSNTRVPPRGFELEYDLGCVHCFQLPGSAELRTGGEQGFECIPDPGDGTASVPGPRSPRTLGFVGQDPLPLLERLELAFHPPSDAWVLVSGAEDMLQDEVTERRRLGFIEQFPILPRVPPNAEHRIGLRPLLRTVHAGGYRHRVAAGAPPQGELSLELGVMHEEPQADSVPIWIVDDRIVTAAGRPAAARPDRAAVARWAVAPLTWRDLAGQPLTERARASVRRVSAGGSAPPAAGPPPGTAPAGYLWTGPDADFLHELFTAVHPITGDQLVTPWPTEAEDLGYGGLTSIGWAARLPLVTGSHDPHPVPIPWASRFGLKARRYL